MQLPNKSEIAKGVVYLRVSTEEQVDNFSLDTQEDICLKEAQRRGIEIVKIFREEGRSAKTIVGRPVLIELLEYCRKNKKTIDAVLVYRLDRMSRQTSDYLAIRKKLAECNITLLSATEPTGNSPTEKLIETMLAGFAQLDNDVRSERTKNGMRARFLAGLNNGPVPLGYLNQDGYCIKDPATWDKVKNAWDLMATGKKSLREMAGIMNSWGLRQTIKGKEFLFKSQAVSRIFNNIFYAGIMRSSRYPEEVQGQHVPMITKEQFYKVQAIIDGRNTQIAVPWGKRNKDNPDFPLRKIVRCGKCGTPLTGAWSKGNTTRVAYYFCRKRCGTPSIKALELDLTTVHLLKNITPTQDCLNSFISMLRKTYYKRVANLKKRKDEADIELRKLYDFRQALIEKNLSGVYDDKIFKEQNKLIEEKITAVHKTKDDALLEKYNLQAIIEFMKDKFADLGKTYQESDISQIKTLLGSIFPSGMAWGYPGYSNPQISPVYRYIQTFAAEGAAIGDPTGNRTPVSWMRTNCPGPLDDGA
jgi:site-specific DNA recombinase